MTENKQKENTKEKQLYHISLKSFLNVIGILALFILITGALVYVIPAGKIDENGLYQTIDTGEYPFYKILLAPVYMLTNTSDLMSFIGLTIFIIFISGAFQVMKDSNGMNVIIKTLVIRFEHKKKYLVYIITLFFMTFGSIFGIFEEVIILVPLIVGLSLSLGWDSLTGLGMSLLAVGLGFGSATTNPFSVGIASAEVGISALSGLWYRIIIFIITYFILNIFLQKHIRKIENDPSKSYSYYVDVNKKKQSSINEIKELTYENEKKVGLIYLLFFVGVLITLICAYTIPALDGLSIVILAIYFLVFGTICGLLIFKNFKEVVKSTLIGYKSALPAVVMILLALSVKFIIMDSQIAPTITNFCVNILQNTGSYLGIILILLIIIVLEFFISSSTAKAVLVMGILGSVTAYVALSKNTLVLAYIMGDGFTNVIFPTSPVLIISMAIVGIKLKDWYKWIKWLMTILMLLNVVYLLIAVLIGY